MTSITPNAEPTGALSPEQMASMNQEEVQTITSQQPEDTKKYAGKFASVEELERSYAELLKGKDTEEKSEDEPKANEEPAPKEDPQVETDEATYGKAVADILKTAGLTGADLSKEFAETGNISEESFAKLEANGIGRETVNAYIKGLSSDVALAQTSVKAIMDSVGGDKAYADMCSWANKTQSAEELASFDAAVNSGDKNAAQWAVDALYTKFVTENGKESNPVGGKGANEDTNVYRSKSEMQRDMASDLYKKDPAFREQVAAKLKRSNIFTKG